MYPAPRGITGMWRKPQGIPLVIAHRGASAICTENTTQAFERAARDRADGVELDVLLCRSGEVVVFHDDDLRRMLDRPERVADLSYRVLRSLRLRRDSFIPTLAEAFEACGPDLLVNVELKSEGVFDRSVAPLVDRVAAVVASLGVGPRVLVSSFDPRAVWLWRRRWPEIPGALLCESADPFAAAKALTLPLLQAAAVHPQATLCRPALIDRWHRTGYLVNAWTVDDPARLRELAAMGVDGVICNDPAAARQALDNAGPG
jgi:glycerophosphoryl diester phosphodiesterase